MGFGVKRWIMRQKAILKRISQEVHLKSKWKTSPERSQPRLYSRRGLDACDTFYINLDQREDRKKSIEGEFKKIGLENFERFSAVKNDCGALGCTLSHLQVMKQWTSEPDRLLMVCEDDCQFAAGRERLDHLVDLFCQDDRLEVMCLAYNAFNGFQIDDTFIISSDIQTTACYLIKSSILPEMIEIALKSAEGLSQGDGIAKSAIDIVWKELQRERLFCCPIDRPVVQVESYSDIEGRIVNYGV